MGTLRIKRGTKTQLQSNPGYVPAEGELVYTTDTKEVFVGDGALTGGTPVSVSTQNLEDLGNVQALAAQNDQILVYNGSQWAATDNPAVDVRGNIYGDDSTLLVDAINGKIVAPVETTSVTATNLVGNLTGDVTGSVTGNVVGNTTGTHFGNVVGNLDGDMNGSLYGDDSTLLVDAINSVVSARVDTNEGVIVRGGDHFKTFGIGGIDTSPRIEFIYNEAPADGTVVLATHRVLDRTQQKFVMQTRSGNTYLSHHDNGTNGITMYDSYTVAGGLKLKIEPANSDFTAPTEALEVLGNAKATGFVQFGSLTTTQRNALTAANGMVIYNTSDNKFQGYENGAWVNLV